MQLQTDVKVKPSPWHLSHSQPLLLIGSCFTQHIGQRLSEDGFRLAVNPFGILYNPLSIATCLQYCITNQTLEADTFFCHQGLWHSWLHHGSFADVDRSVVEQRCQDAIASAHTLLQQQATVILTLGSAYYYTLRADGRVVANCHKLPAANFTLQCASVATVVDALLPAVTTLRRLGCRVIVTISPVRHWAYGAHGNQLGKAVLLLAVDQVVHHFDDGVAYFPAYEIMMDELRDYRFYDDDMLHPSTVAQQLIYERFCATYMDQTTLALAQRYRQLYRMEQHRPLHPDSEAYRSFEHRLHQLRSELHATDAEDTNK